MKTTEQLFEIARENWCKWRDVWEHTGPTNTNPVLSDLKRFQAFLSEYSVYRTIAAGKADELRKCLVRRIAKISDAHGIDRMEKDLRNKFGARNGRNHIISVLSKVAAFVRPETFVAWDRFAKRGINLECQRSASAAFTNYAQYLAEFDAIWNGNLGREIRKSSKSNARFPVELEGRFLRRVLDLSLSNRGGRWSKKRYLRTAPSKARSASA